MNVAGSDPPYPEFGDALDQLRAFLGRCAWPTDIAWLTSPALTTRGQLIIINPNRLLSRDEAESFYCVAVTKRLGVHLAALSHDLTTSFCYIWWPTTLREAQEALMPNGLKLSIASDARPVHRAQGLRFWWRRLRGPSPDVLRQSLV